jgi:hypothetical protein
MNDKAERVLELKVSVGDIVKFGITSNDRYHITDDLSTMENVRDLCLKGYQYAEKCVGIIKDRECSSSKEKI